MKKLACVLVVVHILCMVGLGLFINSLVTSAVKSLNRHCDDFTYSTEGVFVNGNWFCNPKQRQIP